MTCAHGFFAQNFTSKEERKELFKALTSDDVKQVRCVVTTNTAVEDDINGQALIAVKELH